MTYRKRAEARKTIQRLAHGAALTLVRGDCPEDWRYDLRRGRLYIYGGLLRYIDAKLRAGTSAEELQAIPDWITAYIHESAPTNTAEIKLVA
jgi:hypothetical protein